MRKLTFLFITITVTALIIGNIGPGKAQTSTPVNGIINSDTTWTKASGPYALTGLVAVNKSVTLTIEPGVTVNLNGFYIQVNGTLRAIGDSTDRVSLVSGSILFMQSSSSWNEQMGSGSIIKYAVLSSVIEMWAASPKIDNNTISSYIHCYQGSPIISNNVINNASAIIVEQGSPIISNNVITATTHQGGYAISSGSQPLLSSPIISNNTIYGGGLGIGVYVGGGLISYNIINGFQTGISANQATIERNLIINNHYGIKSGTLSNLIQNNTIANNTVGIQAYWTITLIYNNIQNNTQNSIYSYYTGTINATNNWWGTTDTQAINQTIHDNKNDFNLGTVNFVPFLTAPNPQAISDSTSIIPEFPSTILITIILLLSTLAIVVNKRKSFILKKSKKIKRY